MMSAQAKQALYALGLIHANKGGAGDSATITYLTNALRSAAGNEVIQHGACLGIGLAGMATADEGLYNELYPVLHDAANAVAGEGAALAIGLILMGQYGSESPIAEVATEFMMRLAHETAHEKVIRACSLALAMMVYGKEESADTLIEQMTRDRDPIIRYGGMYATAMAYCGTAANSATRRLLHVAVSDVSDDVRRAAVTCLGFVMFRQSELVPKLVTLLSESFNPHVRYGACMAVGVACAGTGFKDALDLLQPMLQDSVDFVRQGACMALAMVLMQTAEARSPSVKKLREHLVKTINDKHTPVVTKTGAILASGILEAGGRNVTISLQSRAGFLRGGAVVGMVLWMQHWYWYPLMHCISMSFSATMMMGLNKDFDVPKDFGVLCRAPPSMFSYPKVEEKEDAKKLVTTAVLSTTARHKQREARKEKRRGEVGSPGRSESAGISSPPKPHDDLAPVPLERQLSNVSYISTMSLDEDIEPKVVEREPKTFIVSNPERVIPTQIRFMSVLEGSRYVPVAYNSSSTGGSSPAGIILLMDNDPSAPANVVKVERIALGQVDEVEMPEPFEWDPSTA